MRLGPEHIGRIIRWNGWNSSVNGKLLAVEEKHLWIKTNNTADPYTYSIDDTDGAYKWELVEERKKPSDRIREFYAARGGNGFKGSTPEWNAILDYLDESEEKKS